MVQISHEINSFEYTIGYDMVLQEETRSNNNIIIGLLFLNFQGTIITEACPRKGIFKPGVSWRPGLKKCL